MTQTSYEWYRDAVQAAAEVADATGRAYCVIAPEADPEAWDENEAHQGYRVVEPKDLDAALAEGWLMRVTVRPGCPETREYLAKTAR